MRTKIAILGATGSIGQATLEVLAQQTDKFEIYAMSANSSSGALSELAKRHNVSVTGLGCEFSERIAAAPEVDIVLNAISGSAGLAPSVAALQAGKRLCLANKESIVMAGELLFSLGGELMPVDSEHAAVQQCIDYAKQNLSDANVSENISNSGHITKDRYNADIKAIILTASGGPFFGKTTDELADITPTQAIAHPTWNMGQKISIDSATLGNKGLEVIEAHHLFNMPYEQISVLVERTSTVHSMIELVDGSIIVQSGPPDMKLPISWALNYPQPPLGTDGVDIVKYNRLADVPFEFNVPDTSTFALLDIAYAAGKSAKSAPLAFNAANEVAVEAFVKGKIGFLQIAQVVASVIDNYNIVEINDFAEVFVQDGIVRQLATNAIEKLQI